MSETKAVPRHPDREPASRPPLVDDQLADELLARAQTDGVELLGPDGLLSQVTKAVLENHPEMVKGHAAAKETLTENWDRNTFLPFHPGAVKYFQEKGIKLPDKLLPPKS